MATSIASFGLSDPPTELIVREEALVGANGPHFALAGTARTHGKAGCDVAELGVGSNDQARLSGNVLEDKKLLGSVHVAFGASAAIGGTVAVPIHLGAIVVDRQPVDRRCADPRSGATCNRRVVCVAPSGTGDTIASWSSPGIGLPGASDQRRDRPER